MEKLIQINHTKWLFINLRRIKTTHISQQAKKNKKINKVLYSATYNLNNCFFDKYKIKFDKNILLV